MNRVREHEVSEDFPWRDERIGLAELRKLRFAVLMLAPDRVQPNPFPFVLHVNVHEEHQLTKTCVHDRHPILKKGNNRHHVDHSQVVNEPARSCEDLRSEPRFADLDYRERSSSAQ